MKELARILDAWAEWKRDGDGSAILATVVRVEGSAYRRAGARMLLLPGRGGIGVISGGCLERSLGESAWHLTHARPAVHVQYDTLQDADAFFGFGAGCRGVIHVLLERLDAPGRARQMEFFEACRRQRRPGSMATLLGGKGVSETEIGNRLMVFPDGAVASTIANATLHRQFLECTRACSMDAQARTVSLAAGSGAVEVFCESIRPPVRLLVFGAGPDAPPLVRLAKELGWDVNVIDTRPTFLSRERFPLADELILITPSAVLQAVPEEPGTAAIVMSHDFLQDLAVLEALVGRSLDYLGVLGPRSRTERLLRELSFDAQKRAGAVLRRLHAPVGLDIGAETPEEIALAVVAEIQATLRARAGGKLRDQAGPIHGKPPGDAEIATIVPGLAQV
jgi:xanthine/CO dehydrogenase XdhC/CoxF family maturation factor